ncbi:MAG: diacylglycerol kinase family lipid kinase [Candidatus Promineofilum sp.]|nr:diacylglycerol kinase family lipid kinase [Promineifilum sp.]MBP9656511.1 diacylglycerol kinase family lipid kinase [Promineifilum sp.]
MRVKVIINSRSGRGRGREQTDIINTLGRRYGELDIFPTQRPRHATELAAAAADEGYDLVVAAGGDGTVHEVVNGLVRGGDKATLPMGIIPIGSGNDTAFGMGFQEKAEESVERLFKGTPRPLDLARVVDGRGKTEVAINNWGIGFDAIVVMRTETITRVHGFAMYFGAVLQTILFYYQIPYLEITFDGEHVNQQSLFLYGGLGTRGGGGFLLTPDAKWDDDLIDTCLVNPIGRLRMLQMLSSAMKGTHVTSPLVTMRQNKHITVKSSMPMPIHLDGEMFAYPRDNVRQVTVTSLPAAIQVMT